MKYLKSSNIWKTKQTLKSLKIHKKKVKNTFNSMKEEELKMIIIYSKYL